MYNYKKLSDRIRLHEGYRNKIYKDQLGFETIGYGHLVRKKDNFKKNATYKKKLLEELFKKDLKKAIDDFKTNYQEKKLKQNTQEVIIEMIFQMGIFNVLKFKNFNKYIKKNLKFIAALEMIKSKWYKQTPNRVNDLIKILLE